jgi:prepilin-type processing-associated H-X9-DG protein/prepilin-type N-terminal cleavage/methylation domain-containing protein
MDGRATVRDLAGARGRLPCAAFTLIELLVVIGIMAVLAGLLTTAISKAKGKGQSIFCLNNVKQLTLACLLYATDHDDRLPYNLGGRKDDPDDPDDRGIAPRADYNWVNNIMDWEVVNPDNTNTAFVSKGSFSPYVGRTVQIYRCPSDRVLSDIQRQAGWAARVRSYSMNAMVGDAGDNSRYGTNVFNPGYRQLKKTSYFTHPDSIFVFLDEHPDSINDGYFLNKTEQLEWFDLPASYHNGAANFGFADGHVSSQRWRYPTTKPPPKPDVAGLPLPVAANQRADYDWVIYRTSVRY